MLEEAKHDTGHPLCLSKEEAANFPGSVSAREESVEKKNPEGAGYREGSKTEHCKGVDLWISLTSLFSLPPASALEGVVQDVNSHEKFVFLNVVDVHFAGYNFFPRRETQDRMQPLVFR